ncbi:MAG: response regulator [Eubacteriales bacterium]|nr:response regulator [Eubacteriales bacterium]
MYKVILVDDEDLEREGMAALIPWEDMDMQLVDMAWNGIEAMEKIQMQKPDLVITDIKMPVMNGIELIRQARELNPELAFVVLSGYGEFEYTSQAMELGIRHYILKPCDEEKFLEVLARVREELIRQREKASSELADKNILKRTLPHAQEQILNALISMQELSKPDQELLDSFVKGQGSACFLYVIRGDGEFDQLDRFAMTNILSELLGNNKILMAAGNQRELFYLLPAELAEQFLPLARKAHREFGKYRKCRLKSAVSEPGSIQDTYRMYAQVRELFRLGEVEEREEFFSAAQYKNPAEHVLSVMDYKGIREAADFGGLLFLVYAGYLNMKLGGLSMEQMAAGYRRGFEILAGQSRTEDFVEKTEWDQLKSAVNRYAACKKLIREGEKEDERMRQALLAIYENIANQELSLQFLAREVLFMNEDYLGRLFFRHMNEKYSSYLVRIRVGLAQKALEYYPDIRIGELAERIGFAADGQYFAKVFKKHTGMAPSDYRKVRKNN